MAYDGWGKACRLADSRTYLPTPLLYRMSTEVRCSLTLSHAWMGDRSACGAAQPRELPLSSSMSCCRPYRTRTPASQLMIRMELRRRVDWLVQLTADELAGCVPKQEQSQGAIRSIHHMSFRSSAPSSSPDCCPAQPQQQARCRTRCE